MAKPILAYITLMSYMAAYGAFLFAMLLCQDPQMWTLMVWLYEMQNWAPEYMQTAGLTLA